MNRIEGFGSTGRRINGLGVTTERKGSAPISIGTNTGRKMNKLMC